MDKVSYTFGLLLRELDTEVENLSKKITDLSGEAQFDEVEKLSKAGTTLKALRDNVRKYKAEWASLSAELGGVRAEHVQTPLVSQRPPFPVQPPNPGPRSKKPKKKPWKVLRVRLPDGRVFDKKKPAETLIEVVKYAEMPRVEQLGIKVNGENLVSRTPSPPRFVGGKERRYSETYVPPFYIKTHCNSQTKKQQIERISRALNLDLKVELTDPEPHHNDVDERAAPGAASGDWIRVLKRDGPGEGEEIAVRLSDSANNPDAGVLGTGTPLGKALLGARVDDEVEYRSGPHVRKVWVISIDRPGP